MASECLCKTAWPYQGMWVSFLLCICLMLSLSKADNITLYIRPDNDTVCPSTTSPCETVSYYAETFYHYQGSGTCTFLFLPGDHILSAIFIFDRYDSIVFRAYDKGEPRPVIKCTIDSSIHFYGVRNVHLMSLEVASCIVYLNLVNGFLLKSFSVHGQGFIYIFQSTGVFENVSYTVDKGAETFFVSNSTVGFKGVNVFANNQVTAGSGGITAIFSRIHFAGTNTFVNNTADLLGGALYIIHSSIEMEGSTYFFNNSGVYGGMGAMINSQVNIMGSVLVTNNTAYSGGGLLLSNCSMAFFGDSQVSITDNRATNGGGIFLASDSILKFGESWTGNVSLVGNHARQRGGALYVADSNPQSVCNDTLSSFFFQQRCFFQADSFTHQGLYCMNNSAQEAGGTLYGGAVDYCAILGCDSYLGACVSGQVFDHILAVPIDPSGNESSSVSSDPYQLCMCTEGIEDCSQSPFAVQVTPGGSIQVDVTAFGQRNGTVPATIFVDVNGIAIGDNQMSQSIVSPCSTVSYTVFAAPLTAGTLELYAVGPCLTLGAAIQVDVTILQCPAGFVHSNSSDGRVTCVCNPFLLQPDYVTVCNATDGTILRNKNFWVGYDQESKGLILYPHCPLDYCDTKPNTFRMNDSDVQCSFDRVGLLCGQCPKGLSLRLGDSRCEECLNDSLYLLVIFGFAGIALVIFLLLTKLTVATGAINGLLFYANIVAANNAAFFRGTYSDNYLYFLKVFIAWLNLDFGIATCLYDGMDNYSHTWLQYAFPFYIWFLMGFVFLASRYSPRISRLLGTNPVAVMATLLLLSYAKILRTIIAVFDSATLQYENGGNRRVWFYDGNIPFLSTDDFRHLLLFIFSLCVLVLLFIPYTLLLLTSQWLLAKSNWILLSWVSHPRVRAFLDPYHAPYKIQHRYWTGVLLMARLILLVIYATNSLGDPNANLLATVVTACLVYLWVWLSGGFYRQWHLDLLEASFFINLTVLAASTLYVSSASNCQDSVSAAGNQTSQSVVTTISVTIAFWQFLGITFFQVFGASLKQLLQRAKNNYTNSGSTPFTEDYPAAVLQQPTVSYIEFSDMYEM